MKLLRPVIIEGPDGAGKTKLHTRIIEEWKLPSAGHDGGPPKDSTDAWKRLALFAARGATVRDRCPAISDIVYSEALGRDQVIPKLDYYAWLLTFKPFIIYCRPSTTVILESEVRSRAHKPAEHVRAVQERRLEIITAYDRLLPSIVEDCGLDGVQYNWPNDWEGTHLLQRLREYYVCAD